MKLENQRQPEYSALSHPWERDYFQNCNSFSLLSLNYGSDHLMNHLAHEMLENCEINGDRNSP